MDKLYLFLISTITLSCSAHTKVLHRVPLCDCEISNETTRSEYHKKYVCTDNTECVTNNGFNSKWVPANGYQTR